MRITGVKRRSGSPERVFVYVDGSLAFTMLTDVARESGIAVGIGIDAERVARARIDSDPWLAKDVALRLLSHRPRSEAQLRTRLLAKGFSAEVVERCVADLIGARYLDDEEFARAFVLGRVRARPRGRRVLLAELRARGVDAAVAGRALDQILTEESVSDLDLARKAAGRFADFDALVAAPGVPVAALTKRRDALHFE